MLKPSKACCLQSGSSASFRRSRILRNSSLCANARQGLNKRKSGHGTRPQRKREATALSFLPTKVQVFSLAACRSGPEGGRAPASFCTVAPFDSAGSSEGSLLGNAFSSHSSYLYCDSAVQRFRPSSRFSYGSSELLKGNCSQRSMVKSLCCGRRLSRNRIQA